MDFRTEIFPNKVPFDINYYTSVFLFGSCFVENIGQKLSDNKFHSHINPFGILYNPKSISESLQIALSDKIFDDTDLFYHNGLYQSSLHHGSFSDINKEECLKKINTSLFHIRKEISTTDIFFITFGTSYIYTNIDTKKIVGNCHKLPAKNFRRSRMSVEEITQDWTELITQLRLQNPKLKFVFTVSPIRHWADGVHENQLSKSTLLLAIDKLQQALDDVFYFPAYELVLDDLRDYRFYAPDMLHVNQLAIDYIWKKFGDVFFNPNTKQIMQTWEKMQKAVEHRPINANSSEYYDFLRQTIDKLELFYKNHSYIDCEKEIGFLKSKLER